jgi:hypothetical protein
MGVNRFTHKVSSFIANESPLKGDTPTVDLVFASPAFRQ